MHQTSKKCRKQKVYRVILNNNPASIHQVNDKKWVTFLWTIIIYNLEIGKNRNCSRWVSKHAENGM